MEIDDDATSEILVADTDSASGAEASNLEELGTTKTTTTTTTIKTTAAATASLS